MSELIKNYAFYLFAKPSFFEGIARIFDFSNSLETYNESKDEEEADSKATYLDWLAVGDDLSYVMKKYARHSIGE